MRTTFWNAEFKGKFSLGFVRFIKEVNFISTIFNETADFEGTEFQDRALFGFCNFKEYAGFTRTTFLEDADFRGAKFAGLASFNFAIFNGRTDFESSVFDSIATFRSARFLCGCSFNESKFLSISKFNHSLFRSSDRDVLLLQDFIDVDMTNCSFARYGDFGDCWIIGKVKWVWPGNGVKWEPDENGRQGTEIPRGTLTFKNVKIRNGCILDFRNNDTSDDTRLQIYECKMSNILLEGTDCSRILFYDNCWVSQNDCFDMWCFRFLPQSWRKSKRDVVGDEWQNGRLYDYEFKPSLVRRIYQQLARSFREQLDHPRANEFDRGAFEMRRLEALQEWKQKDGEGSRVRGWSTYAGLSIYKYLSHYSGNLGLPIFWWTLLLLICATAYCALDPFVSWGTPSVSFFLSNLAESFRASFSLTHAAGENEAIETIKVLQKVLSAILITLFIFAIRRRFKH